MKNGDIFLGYGDDGSNILSPFGRTLSISDNMIAREERTASGRLVRDIVATKKRITLSYSMISSSDMSTFSYYYSLIPYSEIDNLYIKIYDSTSYSQYNVLMQPFERERVLLLDDGLWGNVKIELDEI